MESLVRALARRRIPLGFLCAVLVLWLAQPTVVSLLSGGVVAAVGEALRVWAAGHLKKSREVTLSGPYRWMAHPLYVGSSIMGAGLAIASAARRAGDLIAPISARQSLAAVKSEEAFLRGRFGDRYDDYRRGRGGARCRRGASASRRRSPTASTARSPDSPALCCCSR